MVTWSLVSPISAGVTRLGEGGGAGLVLASWVVFTDFLGFGGGCTWWGILAILVPLPFWRILGFWAWWGFSWVVHGFFRFQRFFLAWCVGGDLVTCLPNLCRGY